MIDISFHTELQLRKNTETGNNICNVFFYRPICLSRTAMTPGLTQICLLEGNIVARMEYHTNVQFCPKPLSFIFVVNDT